VLIRASCISGPKHLEEIEAAGLELPSVNQVEVRAELSGLDRRSDFTRFIATPVLPAETNRRILQSEGYRRRGVFTPCTCKADGQSSSR
jgi:hypothetical protein